jgi:hypothetical protein
LVILVSIMVLVMAAACAQTQPAEPEEGEGGAGEEAEPVTIAVGDQEVNLAELEQITGKGGFRKSTGTLVGPATFTGPELMDVIEAAGGMEEGKSVEIVASDGYTMRFSYDQLQGKVLTYDTEGEPRKVDELKAIIAVDSDDEEFKEDLPRVAFVADEAVMSDGHFWIKFVAELKIVEAVGDWEIKLSGIEEAAIDRSTFESLATCPDTPHPAQKFEKTSKDGSTTEYEGVPLWVLVSMFDGADDEEGHYRFNRDLAQDGYTIEVIAKDGYAVEFNSKDVAYNDNIIAAYLADGEPLSEDDGPLRIVGEDLPSKKHQIKQLAEIKLKDLPE